MTDPNDWPDAHDTNGREGHLQPRYGQEHDNRRYTGKRRHQSEPPLQLTDLGILALAALLAFAALVIGGGWLWPAGWWR